MSIRKLPLQVALQGGRKMPRCHYRFCLCNTFCQNLIKNFKTCTFSLSDVSKITFHTKTKWLCIFVTKGAFSAAPYSNLYKYFNLYACPSIRRQRPVCPVVPSHFQFLQSYHKMSLTKVARCVLRVRNMHSWSHPWDP